MNREEITEQLVALATYQPMGSYAAGVADLARLLVDGIISPPLRHVMDAATTDSAPESPWAAVLPEGTTMAADPNTTNASDTRNSGDEFQAEWIAAELERASRS
jgi:hypothetical protein